MSNLLIRSLGDAVKARLRMRASKHGRSMEEEAREILRSAVANDEPSPRRLGTAIHRLFRPQGGVDLAAPVRETQREPPKFK